MQFATQKCMHEHFSCGSIIKEIFNEQSILAGWHEFKPDCLPHSLCLQVLCEENIDLVNNLWPTSIPGITIAKFYFCTGDEPCHVRPLQC